MQAFFKSMCFCIFQSFVWQTWRTSVILLQHECKLIIVVKEVVKEEEQEQLLKNREVEDTILKDILAETVRKLESNLYCRKILERANYYTPKRPDYFTLNEFYLERIYVGHGSYGPNGHCTKEKVDDNEQSPSRDAVYISENLIKEICMGVLHAMDKQGNPVAQKILAEKIPPRPTSSEFCFS